MKEVKRFVCLLSALIVILLFAAMPAYAKVDLPKFASGSMISDGANIIDDAVEKELNKILSALEDEKGVEFAIVTIESLGGAEIEDYSIEVANGLGIGHKETNTGLMLLVSVGEPKVRLEVGKGMEYVINDAKAGRYLDDHFVEHRANGDYTTAVDETVRAIIAELPDDIAKANQDAQNQIWIIIIVIIGLAVVLIFCDLTFWDGVILGAIFSGDGGGGGSSGGGGFGGGGFGGGGASR